MTNKKRLLKNYLSRTRYIAYLATPFSALAGLYISDYLEAIWQTPIALIAILICAELLIFVVVELYVKRIYSPSIKELKNILQQLDVSE